MTDDQNVSHPEIPPPPDLSTVTLATGIVGLVRNTMDQEDAIRQVGLVLDLFGDGAKTGAQLAGALLALQLAGETVNAPDVYGLGDVRQKLAEHAGTIREHAARLGLDVGALGIPRDWPETLRPPSGGGGYL